MNGFWPTLSLGKAGNMTCPIKEAFTPRGNLSVSCV